MKRLIGLVIGLAVLAAGAYLGGRLAAQQPQGNTAAVQTAAPPVTRIAIVNLGQVIKNYAKWKNFTTDQQTKAAQYRKDLENKNAELVAKQGELSKPEITAPRRELLEREVRDLQRKLQDMRDDLGAKVSKDQYDVLVGVYKEIEEAVKVYARARNLEMVLHYNDAIGQDIYLPEIFQRRLANNACLPIYSHPDLDITNSITMMLNQRVQATMPQAPAQPPVQR